MNDPEWQAAYNAGAGDTRALREALERIAAGTQIALENGEMYPSPLGACHAQKIAIAALSK